MPLTIHRNPDNPEGGPFYIYSGAVLVGVILHHSEHPSPPRWHWLVNGVNNAPPGMIHNGFAHSLDEAKRDFATNWRRWVEGARLREAK